MGGRGQAEQSEKKTPETSGLCTNYGPGICYLPADIAPTPTSLLPSSRSRGPLVVVLFVSNS
eukprot:scaffold22291_cov32-Tisochrysis_lutea.AAC.4